jgi:TetR/AcrR family transcriptional repressor of nem operon
MNSAIKPAPSNVRENIIAIATPIFAIRGFSAVGLNEVLTAADVPKGSFYHYFRSKDAFGVALLERYFEGHLAFVESTLTTPHLTKAQSLIRFLDEWEDYQTHSDFVGRCLAVKLSCEVMGMSEVMRAALRQGIDSIVCRMAHAINAGVKEGSLSIDEDPCELARRIYQIWMGASVLAKIVRTSDPFKAAMHTTRIELHLQP